MGLLNYRSQFEGVKTINSKNKTATTGSRIGRPTREESKLRHEELLECALDTFLEHGFEQTTMVEIATAVGMSKRTLYAYYTDKSDLFIAAVGRATDRYTVPIETFKAAETDSLEDTLTAIARIRIANVATPTGVKLQRILITQSYRFPQLFQSAFEEGAGPAMDFLADLFARYQAKGEIVVSDSKRAALAFLSLVVGGPARLITSGGHMSDEEIDARVKFTVELFLNGIRSR